VAGLLQRSALDEEEGGWGGAAWWSRRRGCTKGEKGDGTAVVADAFKGGVEKREVGEGALAERCHAVERGYTGGVTRRRIKEGRAPVAFAPRQRMKWWPARARV
jgi:hypothetical protein